MADGIRIAPQPGRLMAEGITDVRGRLFIVRDVARSFNRPNQPTCRICGMPHTCKTYHLQLDQDGTVMVSTRIWERLQMLYDNGGFQKVNVVSTPPSQGIELPPARVDLKALFGQEG